MWYDQSALLEWNIHEFIFLFLLLPSCVVSTCNFGVKNLWNMENIYPDIWKNFWESKMIKYSKHILYTENCYKVKSLIFVWPYSFCKAKFNCYILPETFPWVLSTIVCTFPVFNICYFVLSLSLTLLFQVRMCLFKDRDHVWFPSPNSLNTAGV